MKKEILIRKNNGEDTRFYPEKLLQSLIRSGAGQSEAKNVTEMIVPLITDGMTTHQIYKLAYSILQKKSGRLAGRYKLKKAIFEMGPTGYPFEHLVGELIKLQGFKTQTGVILEGKCIKHEVDVFAKNESKTIFVECKFHNEINRRSDTKVSMYVKSRFDDLREGYIDTENIGHIFEGWLVTNTRFTSDALAFGNCSGLKLISWDYPQQGNLRQMIDESGFHPITTLRTISNKEKKLLLENNVVLCRNLISNSGILQKLGIEQKRAKRILDEARLVISIN